MGIARVKGKWDIKLMGGTIYGGSITRTIKIIIDGNLGPPEFGGEGAAAAVFLSYTLILENKVKLFEEFFPPISDPDNDSIQILTNFRSAAPFTTYRRSSNSLLMKPTVNNIGNHQCTITL